MKTTLTMLLAVILLIAAFTLPALADAPIVKRAVYEGNGKVEIDFTTDVDYKDASVEVLDSAGMPCAADITSRDDDDMDIRLASPALGETYSYTISGVRAKRTDEYGSVSGTFYIPAEGELVVEKVEYDADDRELSFDFNVRVTYGSVAVALADAETDETVPCEVVELERDELSVYLPNRLELGREYAYAITGLRAADASENAELTGVFTAMDD